MRPVAASGQLVQVLGTERSDELLFAVTKCHVRPFGLRVEREQQPKAVQEIELVAHDVQLLWSGHTQIVVPMTTPALGPFGPHLCLVWACRHASNANGERR